MGAEMSFISDGGEERLRWITRAVYAYLVIAARTRERETQGRKVVGMMNNAEGTTNHSYHYIRAAAAVRLPLPEIHLIRTHRFSGSAWHRSPCGHERNKCTKERMRRCGK